MFLSLNTFPLLRNFLPKQTFHKTHQFSSIIRSVTAIRTALKRRHHEDFVHLAGGRRLGESVSSGQFMAHWNQSWYAATFSYVGCPVGSLPTSYLLGINRLPHPSTHGTFRGTTPYTATAIYIDLDPSLTNTRAFSIQQVARDRAGAMALGSQHPLSHAGGPQGPRGLG